MINDFSQGVLSRRALLLGAAMSGALHAFAKDTPDGAAGASISQDEQSPMPPVNATPEELQNLMAYLSGLTGVKPGTTATETSQAGISFSDIVHPKPGEWLTYNGNLSANRYSELSGINTGNVKQ
jgi:hypothetical protein